MWILLVEDEKQLANSIKKGLEEEGYVVEMEHDGEDAELQGMVNDYDVVILDWRLPNRSGKEILEAWRKENRSFPVLMLTALGDLDHKVEGLDAGADDYMSKPFSFDELLARIRALSRRSSSITENQQIEIGPVYLDVRRHIAKVGETELILRQKEFVILELFMNNPQTVFSKTQIAERVWGSALYVSDNTIEATISTLRNKLSDAFEEVSKYQLDKDDHIVQTIRGAGYRLNVELLNDK